MKTKFFTKTAPVCSVVTPLFNRTDIFLDWYLNLVAKLSVPCELIFVLDESEDGTEELVVNFVDEIDEPPNPHVSAIKIVNPGNALFETRADNLGFKAATGEWVIELQSDIFPLTNGFDHLLIKVLESYEEIFCVSGRTGHAYGDVYQRKGVIDELYQRRQRIGLYSRKILEGPEVEEGDGFYFVETVNRGPICYRRSDLIHYDYLDESSFFLGNDDHDLNLRAYLDSGRVCAYRPLRLFSPLELGSTRIQRSAKSAAAFQVFRDQVNPGASTLQRFKYFYKPFLKTQYSSI